MPSLVALLAKWSHFFLRPSRKQYLNTFSQQKSIPLLGSLQTSKIFFSTSNNFPVIAISMAMSPIVEKDLYSSNKHVTFPNAFYID